MILTWPLISFDSGKSLILLDQFSHLDQFFNWDNSASIRDEEIKWKSSERRFKRQSTILMLVIESWLWLTFVEGYQELGTMKSLIYA